MDAVVVIVVDEVEVEVTVVDEGVIHALLPEPPVTTVDEVDILPENAVNLIRHVTPVENLVT